MTKKKTRKKGGCSKTGKRPVRTRKSAPVAPKPTGGPTLNTQILRLCMKTQPSSSMRFRTIVKGGYSIATIRFALRLLRKRGHLTPANDENTVRITAAGKAALPTYAARQAFAPAG
jgi:hypothetical protein